MLKKYLQQIRQGKAMHYGRMLELLPPLFYQKKSEMFKVRQLGSGRWQVSIVSEVLFRQLEQQVWQPASRKEAAQTGNSHQVNTSFGYQLVYHERCQNRQPEVVVLDGTNKFQSYQAKPCLLLIENEECFFRYPEMLPVCGQMLALDFSLLNSDIGFASGSKASSALLTPFYQQYQQIYCAFDFDAAALELFDLLKQRLGEKLSFVTPADFSPWQELFNNKPKHPHQLTKALELAEKHHFYGLLEALQLKGCFLEQEALLIN
ncbi:hypothetical protein EMM73_12030 [Rheinheimera sediminis]|uniref:hypothetical protein n=1 Tax=Rheinheimera sp. YQF-1 TaxID=2499626 RepID=UPI000FDADDF7|nr:hypothetical protein [Rheinheimera sp. YQF-1]RVT45690.1 hypothetical protein EMM73_12030 [Rheinheimera sp. YQF-1]